MTELTTTVDRSHEALRMATDLFRRASDYTTFYQEVFATGGVVRRLFPTESECLAFQGTPEYREIERMCQQLRDPGKAIITEEQVDDGKEQIRVITVRLPASLHEALKDEAHNRKVSMNRLCINKLVQEMGDLPSSRGSGRE